MMITYFHSVENRSTSSYIFGRFEIGLLEAQGDVFRMTALVQFSYCPWTLRTCKGEVI